MKELQGFDLVFLYEDCNYLPWNRFIWFLAGLFTITTTLRIILNGAKRFSLDRQYVSHEVWCLGMLFVYWIWDGTRPFLFWLNVSWYVSDIVWVSQYRKWFRAPDAYWQLRIIGTITTLIMLIQANAMEHGFIYVNALVAFVLVPIAFMMWV